VTARRNGVEMAVTLRGPACETAAGDLPSVRPADQHDADGAIFSGEIFYRI